MSAILHSLALAMLAPAPGPSPPPAAIMSVCDNMKYSLLCTCVPELAPLAFTLTCATPAGSIPKTPISPKVEVEPYWVQIKSNLCNSNPQFTFAFVSNSSVVPPDWDRVHPIMFQSPTHETVPFPPSWDIDLPDGYTPKVDIDLDGNMAALTMKFSFVICLPPDLGGVCLCVSCTEYSPTLVSPGPHISPPPLVADSMSLSSTSATSNLRITNISARRHPFLLP